MAELGCNLTCYTPDMYNINKMHTQKAYTNVFKAGNMNIAKGIRFDGKNHNWMVFDSYLSLPFSYMSFMIKDKLEKKDHILDNNIFDSEPYTYIFNKSTSFMDDTFTRQSTVELQQALREMHKRNPKSLGILKYSSINDFFMKQNTWDVLNYTP